MKMRRTRFFGAAAPVITGAGGMIPVIHIITSNPRITVGNVVGNTVPGVPLGYRNPGPVHPRISPPGTPDPELCAKKP